MKKLGAGKARYVSTILSAADGKAFERFRRGLAAGGRVGKSAAARMLLQLALKSLEPSPVLGGMQAETVRPASYPELENEAYLALEPETERETLIPSAAEAEELAAESSRL